MFLKFPHTPHLTWLGSTQPRGDKVLKEGETADFLSGKIIIEEKVDGANVGLSVVDGIVIPQNRGGYLRHPGPPQFSALWSWLAQRHQLIAEALGGNLVLFGEWCYAVHSIRYNSLPDWFLGFDVYDRNHGRFWSVERRNGLLAQTGLCVVPALGRGHYELGELRAMVLEGRSRLGGQMEGLYVRRERDGWLEQRAKLVRSEFVQSISGHWSSRSLVKNRLSERPLADGMHR